MQGILTHYCVFVNTQLLNRAKGPNATLEVGPEKFVVRASTAAAEERDRLAVLVPYLESLQKLTTREIPIVVFDRV